MADTLDIDAVSQSPTAPYASKLADTLIDRRIQQYTDLGFSRERMLQQMLTARLPLDALRARFPDFPESAFRHPEIPARSAARQLPPPKVLSNGDDQLIGPNNLAAPNHLTGRSRLTESTNRSVLPSVATRSIDHANQQAVSAAEGISFQYVPLIQCSFPHADPKQAATFSRKNGWLELTLGTTRPDVGLPYGVPARLLTIYCTSEAVRSNSPEIYLGDSVHDFLRRLDVPITRGARGSLSVYANQLLRLIHSTVSIDENIRDGAGRCGLHIRQALFVEEAQLWWDDPDYHPSSSGRGGGRSIGNGSSLTLSTVLFHSILERSAPLATHAIKRLRKSPMDLDVYAWLVHRLFHLNKPSMVSWSQLSAQFGHNYREPRTFRRFFLDSLKRVLVVYPDAKLKIADSGVQLLPSRPHLSDANAVVRR